MSNQIVNVGVSLQVAAAPNMLQQTGALVSNGGTNLSAQQSAFLTQASDLTAYLSPAVSISSLVWSSGTVTATTVTTLGAPTSAVIGVVVAGVVPSAYNGIYQATITGANTFTYPLASNPGTVTTQGTAQLQSAVELQSMVSTWFAQGASTGVYVLELGNVTPANAVTALSTWLTNNPLTYYVFVMGSYFDTLASFKTLVNNYTATTAQTYFFCPVSLSTYAQYAGIKSVFSWYLVAGTNAQSWPGAAMAWQVCSAQPSASAQVPPFAFRYLYGVTAAPLTQTQQTAFKAAYCNWVATGAEGGIANTMTQWGTTSDGNDFLYWYSIDWVQSNLNLQLSNTVINGSNTSANPLYYNQSGVNRLQGSGQSVMNSAIAYGLAQPPAAVTATPFAAYVLANPSNYSTGTYNGLAVTFVPNTGFKSITFNATVSNIPLGA